eukprot:g1064.t1
MLLVRCWMTLRGVRPSAPKSVDAWCVSRLETKLSLENEEGWLCAELVVPKKSHCTIFVPDIGRNGGTALVTDKMGQTMFRSSTVEVDGELQISLRRPNGQMLANGSFGDSIWAKWTRCILRVEVRSERNTDLGLELLREVRMIKKAMKEDFDLMGAFGRLFAVPRRCTDIDTAGRGVLHGEVFKALCQGFGLEECFLRGFGEEEEICRMRIDSRAQLKRCLKGSQLRWKRIFGSDGPVKLEVCSGTGDWVVAQALKDPAANWVASELRYDRVWSIVTKSVFEKCSNLAVLAGDAGSFLKSMIPEGRPVKDP